jgi:hypothetical protein
MSGSHLCIPRNETMQPPYFQDRIIMFCLQIPKLINLSVWLFCCSQICKPILGIYKSLTDINVEIGTEDGTIPRKDIHKWDFRCSMGVNMPHCESLSLYYCRGRGLAIKTMKVVLDYGGFCSGCITKQI